MNLGTDVIAKEGSTCKCWWCEEQGVKNYYNDLCFNCTQYLASTLLPGVMGQGKYDVYRAYWDKLKVLVTEKKIQPSEKLLKAYMKSENKTAPAASATNVSSTLETLKRWGEPAQPICPPSRGNDVASHVSSVAPSIKSKASAASRPPRSSAQSIRSRVNEKLISTNTMASKLPLETSQAAPKEDRALTAFEKEFAKLRTLGNKTKGKLAGAGAQMVGRFRLGSTQRASNSIFLDKQGTMKQDDTRRQGAIKGNAILLRQHLLRNPNIVTSINDLKAPTLPSGPLQTRGRGGSVQVKQLKAQALLDGDSKYSKFY